MGALQLTARMYDEAHSQGVTLSEYLERVTPKDTIVPGLTAFESHLMAQGIRTKSVAAKGFISSKVEDFYKTDESKILFPEFVATQLREEVEAAPIIQYLIGMTTPIDSNAYRTAYVDEAAKKKESSYSRVSEGAELSRRKIMMREVAVRIYKYGLALEATYEAIKRMRIDMMANHVRYIASQIAFDQTNEILDIMINGDGNKNTSAMQVPLTSLEQGATALTDKAWRKFMMKFFPRSCDTIVAGEEGIMQIMDMLAPEQRKLILNGLSENSSLTMNVSFPQGIFKPITAIFYPDAPKVNGKEAIFALDRAFAIEKITEIGSDIQESQRFITGQTEVLTISENSGFAVQYPSAMKILTL